MNTVAAETTAIERSHSLTLSTLVQKVYQRHPALHTEPAYEQQIKASKELANSMLAGVASVSLNHYNDAIGSSDGMQEWEGNINMPLWLPGQKQQQFALSQKISSELGAYQQHLKLDASKKVRELIWSTVLAESELKQAYQTWQTAQKLEKDVVSRVEAGDLASTEKLLANTHVLDMHNSYLMAQGKLQHALDRYQTLTGENVVPESYEESLSNKKTVGQEHPSLALLDERIATLRAKQGLAHYDGAVNPTFSIGMRSDRGDDYESFNHSIGVGISFALDDDVYRQPTIATAALELADAEVARQQLELELTAHLIAQRRDLELRQQQLDLAINHDNATQQYVLLKQRAFDLGEIDLVSLLRSQTLAHESRNRKQLLEIGIKQTIAMINQALGVIL
ncbi:MAG: TolC family protein [Gammaproteobacteria bacterium]|nr:TolC family protein [Gammaproteobacteria bacterium]